MIKNIRTVYIIHVVIGLILFIDYQLKLLYLLWIIDAFFVSYPVIYLVSTTFYGTFITFRLSKHKKSLLKDWLLMMLSIHWFTIALLIIDTFSVFIEYNDYYNISNGFLTLS